MVFCLNLCEIYSPNFFRNVEPLEFADGIESKFHETIQRVYIGSSFCSQYFLHLEQVNIDGLLRMCRERSVPVTLTIPIFSQKDLSDGKARIYEILSASDGIIDEITVNDPGMLMYFQDETSCRLNLGRLFSKDPRDCRAPDLGYRCLRPMLAGNLSDPYWKSLRFHAVELDPTNCMIDISAFQNIGIEVGMHQPFCYMTTGNICKFASIHRAPEQKFRPNLRCRLECSHICDRHSGHIRSTGADPVIYRWGRTLYYEASPVECRGGTISRFIYFPVREWNWILHHHTAHARGTSGRAPAK